MGVYLGHDPSCCLMRRGKIVSAIEEERLNRYKHGRPRSLGGLWPRFSGRFGYFPWASVSYCLQAAGCELSDLDLIALGDDQWAKAARDTIQEVIPVLDKSKVLYIDQPRDACHHFHHGLSSFYLSGFQDAAVLVIDGDGNVSAEGYEAETGFLMSRSGSWSQVFKSRYADATVPRSGIGWMYEQVSYLLGYGDREVGLAEPGKTMGLASYGRPSKAFAEEWIALDGFKLDFSGFKSWLVQGGYDRRLFGPANGIACGSDQPPETAKNLAYKVQQEAERAILHLAKTLKTKTGARRLCLGGGVALNSVANGRLIRAGIFDETHIIPAVHDGGQSIGLAVHAHLLLTNPQFQSGMESRANADADFGLQPVQPLTSACVGRAYREDEIRRALSDHGLAYELLTDAELIEAAAQALADGKFIGWFQGRSEIGPRALGARSILACPTFPDAKDRLNRRVKFREGFRPFAPAALAERCGEIFDVAIDSPYMLIVADVRGPWVERIPAVVHVDGSARLQTVRAADDSRFHALISALDAKTGAPVVLNTSFNLAGMPIVESPTDAIQCFLQTQLDELYLGNTRVTALRLEAATYAVKPGWTLLGPIVGGARPLLVLSAPDGTTMSFNGGRALRDAVRLMDGETSLAEIIGRLALSDGEHEALDAAVKKLMRLGCVELRLGARRISGARHESSWDCTLYGSG
jgi:carbamoyltransferase